MRHLRKLDRRQWVLYGVIGLIGLALFGYLITFILFAWYSRGLPSPDKLSTGSGVSTVFYDRDGKVIYEMFKDKNRVPVASKDISDYLKKATVAIEDKHFYQHKGISELGIIRAVIFSLVGQKQGGSTITQQLIKNVLLTSERSLSRKIREAILTGEVEKRYSKDEILTMYLNEAPYGGTFWGVGSAARGYFDKDPKNLTLLESAILAGLPQNPSNYSPFIGTKDLWKGRTKDVLRRMREDGYITKKQEDDNLKQLDSVKFISGKQNIFAPHFIFYLKKMLEDEYGSGFVDKGIKVKTTLSYDVQQTAQTTVKDEINSIKDKYKVDNGAAVVLDVKSGDILAYVGAYDFNDETYGKFDVISQGTRQPGSTLKPIEYALAFERGYTPATMIMDVKTTFPNQGKDDYIPENYDLKYRGPVQLRFALGNSLNVPAVKMLAMLGLRDFMQKCYDMGISTMAPTTANMNNLGLSASLGGGSANLLELTSAYTVFARGGTRIDTQPLSRAVLEITDYKGKVIYKQTKPKEQKVLSPESSFLISHILSDNNARMDTFGSRSLLVVPGKTVAVKTGTTNDKRDNWAVGFTKSVAVGVWVGNHDNAKMNEKIASGATGASPIWNTIMAQVLKNKNYADNIMDKPDKVKAVQIDSYLGGAPKDGTPNRTEYFIDGTEPKDVSPFYKKVKVSKANGKLANEVEVKSGNYDEKEFIWVTENDPVSADGKNRWQEAIDAWSKDQKDDKYHYPTETSDSSADGVVVSIKSPGDKQTVNSNNIEFKIKITSMNSIKQVKIWANGDEKKVINGDNKEVTDSINLPDGAYEIKVQAWNDKDKSGDSYIHIGVNKPWDYKAPTATPVPPTAVPATPKP